VRKLFCLYGSVTGKAQSIAEQLTELAQQKKYDISIHCLGDVGETWTLEEAGTVIIISSTTGEGEQPENVIKFWRKLRGKTLPTDYLASLNFTVLGLGDTNYNEFCKAGKALNRRLLELGANPFYPPGWADDGTGLEIVVEPWMDDLWSALEKIPTLKVPNDVSDTILKDSSNKAINCVNDKLLNDGTKKVLNGVNGDSLEEGLKSLTLTEVPSLTLPPCPQSYLTVDYLESDTLVPSSNILPLPPLPSSSGPVQTASLSSCNRITGDLAVKHYYEVNLELDPCFPYQAGDTVAVICPNTDQDVSDLCSHLELDSQWNIPCQISVDPETKKVRAKLPAWIPPTPTTLDIVFRHFLDIRTVPKKPLIRRLVDFTTDAEEKHQVSLLCSKEGGTEYKTTVRDASLSLLQLLSSLPSCKPPVSLLLEQLPRLQPRPYSLSSSPKDNANKISFVFSEVLEPRPGLATTWLSTLPPGSQVPVYPRTNNHFKPPEDANCNFIMVAAGSGLGPFLGFLRDRKRRSEIGSGKCWLIFGCRDSTQDYIYRSELEEFKRDGLLDKLDVCFSRQGDEHPKYVQDRLKLSSSELRDWLVDEGAMFYVCGDAVNMAKSVKKTVEDVVSEAGGQNGAQFVTKMLIGKKYLQDIWT